MNFLKIQKGQSLIEIIFAITIFTIGVITIGYLVIDAIVSLRYSTESTQARFLAEEGIEAVTSIRNGGFNLIPSGTYGLALENGLWTLISEPDIQGKFTRTITITNIDDSIKEVLSKVTWNVTSVDIKDISYTTQLTNWRQSDGQANDLNVSISDAALSASGTELIGLSFENTGTANITLDKMSVMWSAPTLLERITIDDTDVFTASTSGSVSSGSEIDIEDFQVSAHSGSHYINNISFDSGLSETNFIVMFTLEDGSKKYLYISL